MVGRKYLSKLGVLGWDMAASVNRISGPEWVLSPPNGSYATAFREAVMSRQSICTRVNFNCEECDIHVSKWWHPRMPGRPRFCSLKCKTAFQRRAKPVSREWLEQKYVVEGLDCTQIAKLVGRDSKRVWEWLRNFGIPTRSRGCNAHQLPKGREPGFKLSAEAREKIRQARIRDGHVPYLKNGKHWLKGVTGSGHPSWKGGITPERQAFYATKEWASARCAVYKRDKRTCQRCGKVKMKGDPFDIHHIVSFECVELRAVVSNLVLLCEGCHYWVHSKANEKGEFVLPCSLANK